MSASSDCKVVKNITLSHSNQRRRGQGLKSPLPLKRHELLSEWETKDCVVVFRNKVRTFKARRVNNVAKYNPQHRLQRKIQALELEVIH